MPAKPPGHFGSWDRLRGGQTQPATGEERDHPVFLPTAFRLLLESGWGALEAAECIALLCPTFPDRLQAALGTEQGEPMGLSRQDPTPSHSPFSFPCGGGGPGEAGAEGTGGLRQEDGVGRGRGSEPYGMQGGAQG